MRVKAVNTSIASSTQRFVKSSHNQALCSSHRVPARHVVLVAPVRGHFGRCGTLESSESWVLYDSLPMTRTDGSTHDSSDDRTIVIQQ